MKIIGNETLWSFSPSGQLKERNCFQVRAGGAALVKDYTDLATKIATLQFENPDYMLLFRGQNRDHTRKTQTDKQISTLMPSLLRSNTGSAPSSATLVSRFKELVRAERLLVNAYENEGFDDGDRLRRQRILRWSILQHYEICRTPLLDVTNSLRIAASFATGTTQDDEAFIFVLGVPNLSGAITASAEAGLQIVRLASVCPPSALRPHFQEGYLLGEYPDMAAYDNKENYSHYEIDFGRRLIAKFRFSPSTFWNKSEYFPRVEPEALYPDGDDPLFKLAKRVKDRLED